MKKSNDRVLVVAAHPDDEILGCGGTVARHVARGDLVHVLILSQGEASRHDQTEHDNLSGKFHELRLAAKNAANVLGTEEPTLLTFPDNRFDSVDQLTITKEIEKFVAEIRPNIVYTHYAGDLNRDHQITCQSAVTAVRPLPNTTPCTIRCFETLSSTEWGIDAMANYSSPTFYVDITPTLELKLSALGAYEMEMRPSPHPRSLSGVKSLAMYRGSNISVEFAEAFYLVREIWGVS